MSPLIFLYQEQLQELIKQEQLPLRQRAVAFGSDQGSVFHAYLRAPRSRPAGSPCLCLVELTDTAELAARDETWARQASGMEPMAAGGQGGAEVVVITLGEGQEGRLQTRGYVVTPAAVTTADVKFVPERSELFSRSKGLLETSVLAEKKVAIVGLGSGGSMIAVELAKAGVGRFVLIDFDRLELSNVSRHVCGINDLGRLKTLAMRDAIWQKNPCAEVEVHTTDINKADSEASAAVSGADLIIGATDTERSRFNLNRLALANGRTAVFGRAITRAAGGDVLRVRPGLGPCYACVFGHRGSDGDQELSSERQVRELWPAYAHAEQVSAAIQVGLSSDIAPIANMVVKLALVELSRGLESGIASLEDDLVADYYIWANRRDVAYAALPVMDYSFNRPAVLRWYGARMERDATCPACGSQRVEDDRLFG